MYLRSCTICDQSKPGITPLDLDSTIVRLGTVVTTVDSDFSECINSEIQLWTFAYIRLLNRPYENEVTLNEHN